MTAPAPEAQQDTFTLDSLADVITFPISYKQLYGDRKFEFCLRVETEDDVEALREMFAGRKFSDHDYRIERLARLITRPPTGFTNFPEGGDLAEATRRYFRPKKATKFLQNVLGRFDSLQTPDQFFL